MNIRPKKRFNSNGEWTRRDMYCFHDNEKNIYGEEDPTGYIDKKISDLNVDDRKICIVGKILKYKIETMKNGKIVFDINVQDTNKAIIIRSFGTEEEAIIFIKCIKIGETIKIYGHVTEDYYEHSLNIHPISIAKV